MASILFVDDEQTVRENYDLLLRHHGFDVTLADSVQSALKALKTNEFDLIITDMRMSPETGLDLLRKIKASGSKTEVIVFTGHADVQNAIEAMKLGALDYLTKDTDHKEVILQIQKALEKKSLHDEVDRLRARLREEISSEGIVGKSPAILKLISTIGRVAPTDSRVLITGESGTGKELVAATIHRNSLRKEAPFVPINCGAIPLSIQESELFGHVRGAFTGAEKDRKGLLESAAGGTVFLDEVADMSASTQIKLLRFLENGELYPVGSSKARILDVRIVAATNKSILDEVTATRFREDLLYRLNVVSLHVPPLRERTEDIAPIAHSMLPELNKKTHKQIKGFSVDVIRALEEYRWPGNVRELKNVIERAAIFANSDTLELEDLPEDIFAPPLLHSRSNNQDKNDILPLEAIERQYILSILEKLGGNKLLTAQQLNIATTTLYRKLRRYGIE